MPGVSALLLVVTLGVASGELGKQISFTGLAAMMLGGMGNMKGAVVGGYLLGILECLVRGYFIGDWTPVYRRSCD